MYLQIKMLLNYVSCHEGSPESSPGRFAFSCSQEVATFFIAFGYKTMTAFLSYCQAVCTGHTWLTLGLGKGWVHGGSLPVVISQLLQWRELPTCKMLFRWAWNLRDPCPRGGGNFKLLWNLINRILPFCSAFATHPWKIGVNISAVLRNTVIPEYRERKYEPMFLSKERRCWRHVYNMLLWRTY